MSMLSFSTLLVVVLASNVSSDRVVESFALEGREKTTLFVFENPANGDKMLRFGLHDDQTWVRADSDQMSNYLYAGFAGLGWVDRELLLLQQSTTVPQILLFGLGGGSLTQYLSARLFWVNITVVEIEQAVIDAAITHFGFHESDLVHLIHADVSEFLRDFSNRKYAYIFHDGCDQFGIVPSLHTVEFIRILHSVLQVGGVLATNIVSDDEDASYSFLKSSYEKYRLVFPSVLVLSTLRPEQQFVFLSKASGDFETNPKLLSLRVQALDSSFDYESMLNSTWLESWPQLEIIPVFVYVQAVSASVDLFWETNPRLHVNCTHHFRDYSLHLHANMTLTFQNHLRLGQATTLSSFSGDYFLALNQSDHSRVLGCFQVQRPPLSNVWRI